MTGENACGEYTVVTADTGVLKEGNWYVAEGNVTLGDIDAAGKTVHLILCDGAELTARNIDVSEGGSPTIYAGSTGNTIQGTGKLTVSSQHNAVNTDQGALTVNGGVVSLSSQYTAFSDGGTLTVNGGSFTAMSTDGSVLHDDTVLTVKDGMVVKAGDDAQSASPVTGDGYKQQYYVAIETPPHSHSFICSASSDAITATCTNGDGRCDLTDCKVTLKIVAPTLTIFGGTGDGTATLEGLSDFNAATDMGVAEAQITYEGRTDTTYEMSTTAPTDAGDYTARITLENVVTSEGENNSVTAFVDYTIARAAAPDPGTITDEQKPQARTGDDVIYTGSPITLVTAPSSLPAGCTKVQYSIDGGETWTDEAPAATDAGTYFVWYRFVGDKNHLDLAAAEPIEVVIVKLFGTPDFILPMQLTGIEESAFEGVSDMTVVDAHSCKTIGKDAFKNTGLKQIRLPKDCEIDAGAFGEQEVYVFAPAGGTTQAYRASHDNLIFIEE